MLAKTNTRRELDI